MSQRRSLSLLARGIHISSFNHATHSLYQFARVPSRTLADTIWKASHGASRVGRSPIDLEKASTALTESMHYITLTKLSALSKQHQNYEAEKSNILQAAESEDDPRKRLKIFLDAFEDHNIAPPESVPILNIRRFLDQSRNDLSVPPDLLQDWQITLQKTLDISSHKYEHASLFGQMVMEWLGKASASLVDNDIAESLKRGGRKEMYDQRKEWESIVFSEDSKSDPKVIVNYLSDIFDSNLSATKMTWSPLEALKDKMGSFELGSLCKDTLKVCIAGLLKIDLLSDTKRKTLAEISKNALILSEMVDVLNMEISALDTWSWGDEAVTVDLRRSLNGKYRVYMDEEITQALLLHFIGTKWAVNTKSTFLTFFDSDAWKKSSRHNLGWAARQRREKFQGRNYPGWGSVVNLRWADYRRGYFLLQLPTSFETTIDNYKGDSKTITGESKSPSATKQSLLHLISTEALINTRLYGSFTILQSDFKWFGPSIPHTTILAVLGFLGVSDKWLNVFARFLRTPIKFAMDGPGAQTRVRYCGVPIQHRLSDALSESVLFCLDLAVNKATGSRIYRLHDDLWYFGEKDSAIKAWSVIQRFTQVMGLHLNEEKTGSLELFDKSGTRREGGFNEKLPSGPVSWGFLQFDSSGQWKVDNTQVTKHIAELKLQLDSCKSTFAWVQAWNAYAAHFLANNLGEPANCLGVRQVDSAIDVMERIQSELFAAGNLSGKTVLGHLREKLNARFGMQDLPDGFFFFPIELGGLGLINPLIPLFAARENSVIDPIGLVDEAIDKDRLEYEDAKKAFLDESSRSNYDGLPARKEDLVSLEEYTRYREQTSAHLVRAYERLMSKPSQTSIETTPMVNNARKTLGTERTPEKTSLYDDWVMELYGPDIIRRYGGLAMGEKRLLPIGLAETLRRRKVRWQK